MARTVHDNKGSVKLWDITQGPTLSCGHQGQHQLRVSWPEICIILTPFVSAKRTRSLISVWQSASQHQSHYKMTCHFYNVSCMACGQWQSLKFIPRSVILKSKRMNKYFVCHAAYIHVWPPKRIINSYCKHCSQFLENMARIECRKMKTTNSNCV